MPSAIRTTWKMTAGIFQGAWVTTVTATSLPRKTRPTSVSRKPLMSSQSRFTTTRPPSLAPLVLEQYQARHHHCESQEDQQAGHEPNFLNPADALDDHLNQSQHDQRDAKAETQHVIHHCFNPGRTKGLEVMDATIGELLEGPKVKSIWDAPRVWRKKHESELQDPEPC